MATDEVASNGADSPPYATDFLRWAALEVRFPVRESLGVPGPSDQLREVLHASYPVHEEVVEVALTFAPGASATQQQVLRHRFFQRDRLASVTVGRDAVILETTSYPGWSRFRDQFAAIVEAFGDDAPDGLLRVGLRYIDEIRVPEAIESAADWEPWISPTLAAPFSLRSTPPVAVNVALQYGTPGGHTTLFRAAPFAEGRAVQSEGPLRMPFETPEGPYFLLDTDSSWSHPDREVPEFVVTDIIRIANELHEPSIELFEASITDRLRDEVMRQPMREQQEE